MPGGRAHGIDRDYQEMCRDICILRSAGLFGAYQGTDGIDVPFCAGGTEWRFDVVLENTNGDLLVAECKRWIGPVPQGEVGKIAHTVERLRQASGRAVSGLLFAKTSAQLGALRHAAHEAIEVVVAEADQPLPEFGITVLRYDPQRDAVLRNDMVSHVERTVVTVSSDAVFEPGGGDE